MTRGVTVRITRDRCRLPLMFYMRPKNMVALLWGGGFVCWCLSCALGEVDSDRAKTFPQVRGRQTAGAFPSTPQQTAGLQIVFDINAHNNNSARHHTDTGTMTVLGTTLTQVQ